MLVATLLALSQPLPEVAVEDAVPHAKWSTIVQTSVLARVDEHAGFGAGFEVAAERWVNPYFTVGAFADWVPFTAYLGDLCGYYDKNCLYDYVATGPLVGAHLMPVSWLDLYLRVGAGPAFVGTHLGGQAELGHWIATVQARAGVGIDLHLGGFVFGVGLDELSFRHRNGTLARLGLRLGGAW